MHSRSPIFVGFFIASVPGDEATIVSVGRLLTTGPAGDWAKPDDLKDYGKLQGPILGPKLNEILSFKIY